jgi:hypothetical protein
VCIITTPIQDLLHCETLAASPEATVLEKQPKLGALQQRSVFTEIDQS